MKGWLSKVSQKVLLYFFTNPHREHHLRELAALVDIDPGNLSREMRRLTEAGLFKTRTKGRLKFFSLNSHSPLYKEMRGLILKTQGAEIQIRRALENFSDIDEAFIYGSFATGKMDEKSDIDLLVIGKVNTLQLAEVLRPLEKKLGREIHFRVLNRQEFVNRKKDKNPFLMDVLKGHTVALLGKK